MIKPHRANPEFVEQLDKRVANRRGEQRDQTRIASVLLAIPEVPVSEELSDRVSYGELSVVTHGLRLDEVPVIGFAQDEIARVYVGARRKPDTARMLPEALDQVLVLARFPLPLRGDVSDVVAWILRSKDWLWLAPFRAAGVASARRRVQGPRLLDKQLVPELDRCRDRWPGTHQGL